MIEMLFSRNTYKPPVIQIQGWDGVTMTKSPGVLGGQNGEPYIFRNSGQLINPDYIRIPYQNTPSFTTYSPSTRVTINLKLIRMIQLNGCVVWSRYNQGKDPSSYLLEISPDLKVRMAINNILYAGTKTLQFNQTYEIVAERIANTVYVYIDGVLDQTIAITTGVLSSPATWDWVIDGYLGTGYGPEIVQPPNSGIWEWELNKFKVQTF